MKRIPLYSTAQARPARPPAAEAGRPAPRESPTPPPAPVRKPPLRARRALMVLLILAATAGLLLGRQTSPAPRPPTQADIDRAVLRSLETKTLPSATARAYARIIPSVVRVAGKLEGPAPNLPARKSRSAAAGPRPPAEPGRALGSGVVITEQGAILTSLHVVLGAREIEVRFADGSESPASIASVDPANDLAVLRAAKLPDDLQAATLVSTAGLRPGDEVAAVGFPFGYGPSVSAGVVSGLGREFRSAEGDTLLGNLIQFDAAANPGNSGGPLVNMKGEVVGIVAALLNPVQQRFFVGLGFAVPIENATAGLGLSPF